MGEIKYNSTDAEGLITRLNNLAASLNYYNIDISLETSRGEVRDELLAVQKQLDDIRGQMYLLVSRTAQVLSYAHGSISQLDNDIASQLGGE